MKRLGVIINPVAGLGGSVGLKGSDGLETQRKALELGATPKSPQRMATALKVIASIKDEIEVITYPGVMGESSVIEAGFTPIVVGEISGQTTSIDTRKAALDLVDQVDLLIFAGGDGTARDIFDVIDSRIPVIGVPAGVKIHSAVYATTPRAAGEVAKRFLSEELPVRDAEVMDIDEEAFRDNRVSAKLYGYMTTPYVQDLLQGSKEVTGADEEITLGGIAAEIVEEMDSETIYIIGPGSSTRPITDELGLEKTLLGVDIIKNGKILAKDANEEKILSLLEGASKIIVTIIGGQGFIFGRGNQQISPKVIKKVGKENIIIIATPGKLATLRGRSLHIDTGDNALDEALKGWYRVVIGYGRRSMYKVR